MQRRHFLGCLATAGLACCAADEEKIWREYVEWYRRQPATGSDSRRAYYNHLRLLGLSGVEVEKRSIVIERLAKERAGELQPIFFDRTYASPPRFNVEPNALLVDAVKDLRPGRALDIHMGQGRNALFLASKNWDVTGFDFSPEGVRTAAEAARKAGLKLNALVRRHEDFDFGREQWDLVVMSYTWVPLRDRYPGLIIESLRSRGIIVFEHLMDESGSENAAPWLPRPNELLRIFGSLRILRYEDVHARADWSWRSERIARMIAQKQ